MSTVEDTSAAVASLIEAQARYVAAQEDASTRLAKAQATREQAMRRVAALGLSHRRIGTLTDLSHTRVNQILGRGTKPLPPIAHQPDFGPPPASVDNAAIRVMAKHTARAWSPDELREELAVRGWPSENLNDVLVALATDGVILAVDGDGFTIHAYA